KGNVVFLTISIASVTAALAFGWARLGDESAVRFALTFVALFAGFQCFYYALHRAMHTPLLLPLHRWHHVSHVTTPMSGQSTSVGEALGWMLGYVALPIAMSLVCPISLWGWLAYLSFNVVGNIAGHANSEIVRPSRWLWWRSTTAGTFTYHALHHARYTGNYGFESTWADRLFRTEFRDWPTLHARIWHKQPLQRLQEHA
ncbi:MAG TPA: sterol desaturase family protein, partial [Myxococcota bacterium]